VKFPAAAAPPLPAAIYTILTIALILFFIAGWLLLEAFIIGLQTS
jgi:hypothetical protein